MKKTICLAVVTAALCAASPLEGQERVAHEDAVRMGVLLNLDLAKLANTPLATDADTKRPFGVREGSHGGLVLPEAKLQADTLAQAGRAVVPVGQFWFHQLAPVTDGVAMPAERLKLIAVNYKESEVRVVLCVLGVRRTAAGELELLVYGQGKEPLLTLPLKKQEVKQEFPLEFDAERTGDGARITLKLVGKYTASFQVAEFNAS